MEQLMLVTPEPRILQLDAYLACALTGLDGAQRQLIFHLSDTISQICSAYGIDLYEPRKKTDPVHHKEVPDTDVFRTDRERVLGSDLLIHLTHHPSTGSGEELDFAYNALLPIMVISHSENRVSRMITGIPSLQVHIKYEEPEELRQQLHECLPRIRPLLEERKMAFAAFEENIVGMRIRALREELELTREAVSKSVPGLTPQALEHIEEHTDRESNPSLIQLRQLAAVLHTTVADLVEPCMEDRMISTLNDWVTTGAIREVARSSFTKKDRNRILRRILLRVIDSLEEEQS